jgi:hypothetical protein
VDAITDHLPLRRPRGRIRDVLGGFGVVNGLLVTAVLGAAIASYFVIAGTAQPTAQVRTATVARGVVLATISATGALQAAQGLNVDRKHPHRRHRRLDRHQQARAFRYRGHDRQARHRDGLTRPWDGHRPPYL